MKEIIINNIHELEDFANKIKPTIHYGDLILLNGPLGSGKTAFAQAIAKAFGIREKVKSPTYNLKNEYDIDDKHKLIHLDLYRLEGKEVHVLEEIIYEDLENNIVLVEWSSKSKLAKHQHKEFKINVNHDLTRTIKYE